MNYIGNCGVFIVRYLFVLLNTWDLWETIYMQTTFSRTIEPWHFDKNNYIIKT